MTQDHDILTDADSILDLLDKHQELSTHQLKLKTGFFGNRFTEALRFLKNNSRIFSTAEGATGVTHWRLNRNAAEIAAALGESIPTPAPAPRRKPYTPNHVSGFYSYRGNIVIKLDRRASAHSVTLSQADLAMIASLMRDNAP